MIQAPLKKPVEAPKPRQKEAGAEDVSNKKTVVKDSSEAKSSEASEFEATLETSLSKHEPKVQLIQVSAEQTLDLPSSLVQPTSVETGSPKVFNPELTKGVEKLIAPKSTEVAVPMTDAEVLKLAQGEMDAPVQDEVKTQLAVALNKTQGRSPAIDFAKAEVDPQLLSNEDFLIQKNIVNKKPVANPYGMKALPVEQQKAALEAGLKQTQVVSEATELTPVNSQEFILGLSAEQKPLQGQEVQTPKTFDMTNIKTTNANELMNQITDYVVQAKAAKEPTVNMRVAHEDLGVIDITVTKTGANQDAIAVNIGTHSIDGKNFFQQNSKELFSHLTNAGLNVSDLKVETPTQTAKNDFDFNSQSGRNQQGSEKQFGSEQNQRRHESERRQDLWKLLNKEAA